MRIAHVVIHNCSKEEIIKAKYKIALSCFGLGLLFTGSPAFADCSGLPTFAALKTAVASAVGDNNGGLAFNMWATVVSNDGTVCAVAFSGSAFTDQWLGSRVISAQKANTANAFSLGSGTPAKSAFPHGLALSTANPLLSRAAWRQSLWPAAQQSGRYRRRLWQPQGIGVGWCRFWDEQRPNGR